MKSSIFLFIVVSFCGVANVNAQDKDLTKWGDAFNEGCSRHNNWAIFHDMQGLMNLMSGREKFVTKLDSLFTAPPKFDYSYYGVQIHEIKEMALAGMGQYAHGNQPIQHGIYLYDWAQTRTRTEG